LTQSVLLYETKFVCYQVLDVDLVEGRIRANFQLPVEPSLNGIVRHHAVDCLACILASCHCVCWGMIFCLSGLICFGVEESHLGFIAS